MALSGTTYFTVTQSVQMVILAPCVLMILYFLTMVKHRTLAVIPVLYFVVLGIGSLHLLLPVLLPSSVNPWLDFIVVFAESLIPALSFLLVVQFIMSKVPPLQHWSVLAVPLCAASPFIYGMVFTEELCVMVDACFSSAYAYHLNNILLSSFVFMLLTVTVSRQAKRLTGSKTVKLHKYWLIISLIIFNLMLLLIDLRLVQEAIDEQSYLFARSMVKLAFVYMVLSSVFRVFYDMFEIQQIQIPYHKSPLTKNELSLAEKAQKLLAEEKVYRDLKFNRSQFAQQLGIQEHQLSRIINQQFNKSFSEMANDYRINEAKELLVATDSSITAISFDVGFSSITSFNRVFKETVGTSPSDYRQKKEHNA